MLDKAIREFDWFVKNYDMNTYEINLKYYHSIRVMNLAMDIARSINLDNEGVFVAGLIGLLHDIGRFDQWTIYKTFRDDLSLDHSNLGLKVLNKDNYIRKYIDDDSYDEVIKKSIFYHNKFVIGDCSSVELLFSKIIRDADKLDIYLVMLGKEDKMDYIGCKISDEVLQESLNERSIDYSITKNKLDKIILTLSMVYDLNYKFSFNHLKESNMINMIIDKIIEKSDDSEIDNINNIRNKINGYLERMCLNG